MRLHVLVAILLVIVGCRSESGPGNSKAGISGQEKQSNENPGAIETPIETQDKVELSELATDQFDGKILYVDSDQAFEYCKARGTRLPTARELAEFAKSYGARGIVQKESPWDVARTQTIKASSTDAGADSPVDEFFYEFQGYEHSEKENGRTFLWSDSVKYVSGQSVYSGAYRYNSRYGLGSNGSIETYGEFIRPGAIRCVKLK